MKRSVLIKGGTALLVLAAAVGIYQLFGDYLTLESIKQYQKELLAYCQAHPVTALALFFLSSMLWVSLAIPAAMLFPVIGGALFGTFIGGSVSALSMGIGCAMAFLLARFILGSWLQEHFADRLQKINRGIEKDGLLYLVILRYMPVVPFFLTNLLTGLTTIPAFTFFWATTLTILPGNLISAYIGSLIAQEQKITHILPELIIATTLLSTLPLLVKKIIIAIRARRNSRG